jgi:outer membrane protein assembly factor BamB
MTSNSSTPRNPLRLWPGVVAVTLQWLGWVVVPVVVPAWAMFGMLGGVFLGLVILVWWVFFSRAAWSERVGALALMVLAVAATSRLVHPSVSNGMMGMMLYVYSIPVLCLALVAWAVASAGRASGLRRASMVAAIVIACGTLTLIRTDGIRGEGGSDLEWRWTPTAEERLLAQAADEPEKSAAPIASAPPPAKTSVTPAEENAKADEKPSAAAAEAIPVKRTAEWPGFRGPERDGIVRGVRIETDWSRTPPVELWRKPIGPGWSSFAVDGDFLYTQEQRGDYEVVSCYRLSTGAPVWRHRDAVRFWESNAGPGPRGTPTVQNGRVYTMGATGVLNALNARNGARFWSRNAATDTGVEVPDWGVASSPLVINDLVIVAVSGRLAAYDIATGNRRWLGPTGGAGYSSPHLLTIDGVPQILLLRGSRTISVAPADGTVIWEHTWQPGVGIVQPALAADGDVLIATGDGMGGGGIRRVAVARGSAGWSVEERWTSRGLKPYFNDFVAHEGHAFGFDGSILACIDLTNGERKWKGGRYGHGQMVVLQDQDLLLVLSEEGELALVAATPDKFTELARFPALDGKTWNHPVLVGNILLVRNGEEMAAFRLSLAGHNRPS